MSGIREFRRDDIAEVADLWLKVFRRLNGPASESLRDYFREMFFDGPWRDKRLPSLVCEEQSRRITGFLGVLPRTMIFDGRSIKVAVATQLMMDGGTLYAAVKLMRKFFAGPQDLSLSDGANENAERLWRAAGGDVALLDSLVWTRALRPAQYAVRLLKRRRSLIPVTRAIWPVCQAVDAAVVRSRLGRHWLPEEIGFNAEEHPSEETLLWCVRHLTGNPSLHPEYELDSFRWLLSRAGEKQMYGNLQKCVLRDPNGEIAGWYLYYLKRGGIGQVLQFGGRPKCIGKVLNHLFYQAWKQGAVAISGKLEPRFAKDLVKGRCQFNWPGYVVLVQSRNQKILNAIHQGDVFLTRLEGEWWARFSDPAWSPDEPSPCEAIGDVGRLAEVPRMHVAEVR